MARAKKHKVRTLVNSPLGRPGLVIEVTKDTPHVDHYLNTGVLEYVEEESDGDQGEVDAGSFGAGEGGTGGESEDHSAPRGGGDTPDAGEHP